MGSASTYCSMYLHIIVIKIQIITLSTQNIPWDLYNEKLLLIFNSN